MTSPRLGLCRIAAATPPAERLQRACVGPPVADAVVGVVEIPGCSGLDVAVGLEACDGVALGLVGVDYGSPTVTLGAV